MECRERRVESGVWGVGRVGPAALLPTPYSPLPTIFRLGPANAEQRVIQSHAGGRGQVQAPFAGGLWDADGPIRVGGEDDVIDPPRLAAEHEPVAVPHVGVPQPLAAFRA